MTITQTVLLVEDTPSLRKTYLRHLSAAGFDVLIAASADEALRLFRQSPTAVAVIDLSPPDSDGTALLREMRALRPSAALIVLTADRSVEGTVTAMRAGASNVLPKPLSEDRLLSAVAEACNSVAPGPAGFYGDWLTSPAHAFTGQSKPMQEVYKRIESAARTSAPVFITGESGTGKELCAQTIHALSPRTHEPFSVFDCAATSAERFESELFGHVRGAFVGAVTDRPGLATIADGGTLFLDEICELAPSVQPKLLRFLQTMTVRPVGSDTDHPVDLRIIAASTISPQKALAEGRLREDLYYRLQVVTIEMPPLRERVEDIVPLAEGLLRHYANLEHRSYRGIDPCAAQILTEQPWPGNVRQMMSVLRAITVMHDGEELRVDMLPDGMLGTKTKTLADRLAATAAPHPAPYKGMTLAEIERAVVEVTLLRHGGSVPKAARELAVAPSTLYRKLESWNLPEHS